MNVTYEAANYFTDTVIFGQLEWMIGLMSVFTICFILFQTFVGVLDKPREDTEMPRQTFMGMVNTTRREEEKEEAYQLDDMF